jgi:hypothetical protein
MYIKRTQAGSAVEADGTRGRGGKHSARECISGSKSGVRATGGRHTDTDAMEGYNPGYRGF